MGRNCFKMNNFIGQIIFSHYVLNVLTIFLIGFHQMLLKLIIITFNLSLKIKFLVYTEVQAKGNTNFIQAFVGHSSSNVSTLEIKLMI